MLFVKFMRVCSSSSFIESSFKIKTKATNFRNWQLTFFSPGCPRSHQARQGICANRVSTKCKAGPSARPQFHLFGTFLRASRQGCRARTQVLSEGTRARSLGSGMLSLLHFLCLCVVFTCVSACLPFGIFLRPRMWWLLPPLEHNIHKVVHIRTHTRARTHTHTHTYTLTNMKTAFKSRSC